MVDGRDITGEDIEGYIQRCLTYGAISQSFVDISIIRSFDPRPWLITLV